MITTKLQGGLGNQMFQYSLGRAVAKRLGTDFQLDVSTYHNLVSGDTPRAYALGVFNVVEHFAPIVLWSRFYKSIPARAWRKLLRMTKLYREPVPRINVFRESGYSFDERVFSVAVDTCFEGFWQSERYFSDVADLIRRDFSLKSGWSAPAAKLATSMANDNHSVSLHVRRSDYVTNKAAATMIGTCSPEYYAEAIALIRQHVAAPRFYVFSDDITWVKANLQLGADVNYVSELGIPDCEELMLMSMCHYHVVANSSFSWWGAWLDAKPNKLVVAPARWFADTTQDSRDLIPSTWIRI